MKNITSCIFLVLFSFISLPSVAEESSCQKVFSNELGKNTSENTDVKQPVESQKSELPILNSKETISLFFSQPENIQKYKYQKMYLTFAEEHYQGHCDRAYDDVKAALEPEQFALLEWKRFFGTVSKYQQIENKLFIKDVDLPPEIKEELKKDPKLKFAPNRVLHKDIIGMDALANLADKYFFGDMGAAQDNLLAIMTVAELKQTHWNLGLYSTTKEYRKLRSSGE